MAIIVTILDQWSKMVVFDILESRVVPYIEVTSFFNLVMVRNYGVSFGMFDSIENGQVILSAVAIIITICLLVWLKKAQNSALAVALGLIIGGAAGNVIDRLRDGAVADFLDFHVAGYHWPAFNVADSAVFIGVVLILLDGSFNKNEDVK